MDYLLIIVLGIVVISIWNSNRDAHEQMREALDRLEHEIDFLRSQLATLVKANAKAAKAGEAVAAVRQF
jgi:phage shock protein A